MKIIYYSHSPAYAAYAMAAIHLRIYRKEVLPCWDEILKQWELCFIYDKERRNLIYMGLDEALREVYILGCGNHGKMIEKAYDGFDALYGIEEENHYIDVNRWDGKGRYHIALSRRFPYLRPLAQRLFIGWFRRRYPTWARIVQGEKEKLLDGVKP